MLKYKPHCFLSDFRPEIGVAAYLRDHLFWELMNALFGIVSLALW